MEDILSLIGRDKELFLKDMHFNESELTSAVKVPQVFLVLGGAGSIGQAVTKEIFKEIQKKYMLLILVKIIW